MVEASLPVQVLWVGSAFLCGTLPSAVWLGRIRGVDIRREGSGNPGASNLGRVCGRPWGVACFIVDLLKGLLPVLGYGAVVAGDGWGWSVGWVGVAVAAVLGHVLNPWLGFRGGKGVATGLGAVLGFWPALTAAGLAAFTVWLACMLRWGYVGLASVVAAAVAPLLVAVACWWFAWPLPRAVPVLAMVTALATMILVRHRKNLQRLRAGTEQRAAWAVRGN